MTLALGTVPAGTTIYIPFSSYAGSTGASVTMTGLAVTDIEIYKNGSTTQRASDAGYTLLDTDGIDFDGITGLHGFSVDLNDNTDAGFFSVGASYMVAVSAITVDSQTVNFWAAVFRIGPAESVAGYPKVDVSHVAGTSQTAGDIIADTNDIQTRLPAALVGGRIDASVGAMAADTITAAATAADFTTEIQSGLATAANLATVAGYLDTEIAAILADTNELQTDWADGGRLDLILDARASQASVDTVDDFLDTEVAAIKQYADRTVVRGTVSATSPTTTTFTSSALSPAGVAADQFKGRIIVFDNDTTTTALRGQATDITASSAAANPLFTFTALTTAPQSGDTFSIL